MISYAILMLLFIFRISLSFFDYSYLGYYSDKYIYWLWLGFTGIIIAWMANLNPFASILVALVMASLTTGADALQIAMKLPESMGEVLQGLVLLPLLAGSIFNEYKLVVLHKEVV